MPKKIDPSDLLYRMVRPPHVIGDEVAADAYDDKYDAQSFNLASLSSPRVTLEKFAGYPGTRKLCKKERGEPDPTYLEMYVAGYRVAVTSVQVIRDLNLEFKSNTYGDEHEASGHVDVVAAKLKAALLAENSQLLSLEEMDEDARESLGSNS